MQFTLGFSPCPNDTFIFDAMVNGKIDTKGLSFNYVLEDVETLNRWASEGKLHITKLSFNAFLHYAKTYALLHSGSALGKGVGPMLIAKTPLNLADVAHFSIAIPGVQTTANLLLSLAFPQAKHKTEVIFSEIEVAVLDGKYDAGLIIHESRFTYQQKGLVKLIDLGEWWEQTMQAMIPLGGIAVRRDIDKETAATIDSIIRESVLYSWKNYPALAPFVIEHSQEMSEEVMRKHIELYVNDYTTNLGVEGEKAVVTLFNEAKKTGLVKETDLPPSIFY